LKDFAWSWSALSTYETCPKKYYHLYVLKDFRDADSSYAADGKFIHDALYKRVLKDKPLPLQLRHYEKVASKFANTTGEKHGEMKLAITRDFQPCDYYADDCHVRVVIDLAIVKGDNAIVVDWKTGKVKDEPTQNALNAAVLSRWMPEITKFNTLYVWLKSSNITSHQYTPQSFTDVWGRLLPRVARIEEAKKTTTFAAKPSKLCGWCPVSSCPHYISRSTE